MESVNETSSHAHDMISPSNYPQSEMSEFSGQITSQLNSSSVHPMLMSSKKGENTPRSQVSQETSLKSKTKLRKRTRASGIDLDKSEEKTMGENFDKIQPILNPRDPVIDFDQGSLQPSANDEKEVLRKESHTKSLSDNDDTKQEDGSMNQVDLFNEDK